MTESEIRKLLGQRIRELRKSKKMSQETLAELCDFSPLRIGIIERAEQIPKLDTIIRISHALNVHIKELLMFAKDPNDEIKNDINNILVGKSKKALKRMLEVCKVLGKF